MSAVFLGYEGSKNGCVLFVVRLWSKSASFFTRAGPDFTKQYHNSAFISVRLSCTLSFT